MNIPIRNLYYIFLYAWGRFPEGELANVGVDESPDLPNLFAKILLDRLTQLVRKGLYRGYNTSTIETRSPRGKLRIDRIIKELTLLRGSAICDVDELSSDVHLNRVLKTTAISLSRCEDVERSLRAGLGSIAHRMTGISSIRLNASHFNSTQLSRHSSDYTLLMRLCEFVFRSLLPEQEGARTRFSSILEDELRMSSVFEEFLRNFYRLEQNLYSVSADQYKWDATATNQNHLSFLPKMKTDIVLRRPNNSIVIDAKFYKKTLAISPYGQTLHSSHLYQISTYLHHERVRNPNNNITGMLIYPQTDIALSLEYELLSLPVLIRTIDLSQSWQNIHASLLDFINAREMAA